MINANWLLLSRFSYCRNLVLWWKIVVSFRLWREFLCSRKCSWVWDVKKYFLLSYNVWMQCFWGTWIVFLRVSVCSRVENESWQSCYSLSFGRPCSRGWDKQNHWYLISSFIAFLWTRCFYCHSNFVVLIYLALHIPLINFPFFFVSLYTALYCHTQDLAEGKTKALNGI